MTAGLTRVETRLSGPILLEPMVHRDARGFFAETFRVDEYRAVGIGVDFVQDNHARSIQGTLRGLHFQSSPGQAKLVRVARGRVFDVIVDVRRGSRTFGEWEGFELDDARHRQLFVPIGFAHGYCVLSETADVLYKVSSYYDASAERGIAWNDPAVAIEWPIADPVLSPRDAANPALKEVGPWPPAS